MELGLIRLGNECLAHTSYDASFEFQDAFSHLYVGMSVSNENCGNGVILHAVKYRNTIYMNRGSLKTVSPSVCPNTHIFYPSPSPVVRR